MLKRRWRLIILGTTIMILAISLVVIILAIGSNKQNKPVLETWGVDYSRVSYTNTNQPSPLQPLDDINIETLKPFYPTVLEIAEVGSTQGKESEYRKIWETIAYSENPRELVEIDTVFLKGWIADPRIMLSLFEQADRSSWDEEQCIAADYLNAMTYLHGNFGAAVLSDEEYSAFHDNTDPKRKKELQKKVNSFYDDLVKEGLAKLKDLFDRYPESYLSILARFDYDSQQAKMGNYDTKFKEETLRVVLDLFPGTAFETRALNQLAASYREKGDYEKAIELLQESMLNPDFVVSKDETAHSIITQEIEDLKKEIQK